MATPNLSSRPFDGKPRLKGQHHCHEAHNMRRTRIYNVWTAILRRCRNPNSVDYERYGARGITVCERWEKSFISFYADMGDPGPGYQIDRIDNMGPYSPDNCRWVTAKENSRNRRSTTWVEYKGERMSLAEMSERCGIGAPTLLYRMKKMGMTADQAAAAPKQRNQFG